MPSTQRSPAPWWRKSPPLEMHTRASRKEGEERAARWGYRPFTIWFTGLSGAGKSTLAQALDRWLLAHGTPCLLLDGDRLRMGLSQDLGFDAAARRENVRRAAELALLANEAGLPAVAALISPLRADRETARAIVGAARFVEVHLATPLPVCEQRDPKGLYRRARAGRLAAFTGISAPYETPIAPALRLDTSRLDVRDALQALSASLEAFRLHTAAVDAAIHAVPDAAPNRTPLPRVTDVTCLEPTSHLA